jgi:hypothetical protein
MVLGLQAADLPKIRYSKDFPGSVPAYSAVWVDKSGRGEYTDSPEGELPIKIQLEPSEVTAIFSLAEKLGNFSRPLESGLKVAFTGTKVFRYLDGAANHEVKLNFTQDPDGQALLDWFERIVETSMHAINLERSAKFDRLGVDKALLQLQVTADRGRLAGARQLLPILDRIAKNQSFFNRARERATAMAEMIRSGKGAAE